MCQVCEVTEACQVDELSGTIFHPGACCPTISLSQLEVTLCATYALLIN